MKKLFLLLLMVPFFVSCSPKNDEKKDETSVIYEKNLSIYTIDGLYYEDVYLYDDFSDLKISFPLICNKDIKEVDDVKLYSNGEEISFSEIKNRTSWIDLSQGDYRGCLVIELNNSDVIDYFIDKIVIFKGEKTFSFNVNIKLVVDDMSNINDQIHCINHFNCIDDDNFVSYYYFETNSKPMSIQNISNINSNFHISKIEKSFYSCDSYGPLYTSFDSRALDYEEVTTPFMCQSNVFDYVFIKITYDEYSDTKFFGDKIKMNVIYNDETSMIISLDFLISDAIKQIKLS